MDEYELRLAEGWVVQNGFEEEWIAVAQVVEMSTAAACVCMWTTRPNRPASEAM